MPGPPAALAGVRRPPRVLLAAAAAVLVLAVLTAAVAGRWQPLRHLDDVVARALYVGDARPGALSVLLEVLTAPGLTGVRTLLLLPVAGWLLARGARRAAVWVVAASTLVGPLTTALKESVHRVRPDFAGGGDRLDTFSFPSGHSSGIATLVVVLLVLGRPRLSPAGRRVALAAGAALALLVAATRLLLGVHFLSDVIGGLALGTAWALVTALLAGVLPGGPRTAAAVPRTPSAGPRA